MDIQAALDWRYAVRQFTNETLPKTKIDALLNATRKSASSYGLQPYRLLVIESQDIRAQLLPVSFGQQKVLHCSHLVVFAAHNQVGDHTVDQYVERLLKLRKVTRESVSGYASHMKSALAAKTSAEKREWAHQQAYIALGTLLVAAAVMQIDSCPMTGIEQQAYDEILGLTNKGLETSAIVALGYRSPEDTSAYEEKVRVEYDDFVLSY